MAKKTAKKSALPPAPEFPMSESLKSTLGGFGLPLLAMTAISALIYDKLKNGDDANADKISQERLFMIVTQSCNSNGVNKMEIVRQANNLIAKERRLRIKSEAKVKELEKQIKVLSKKK